MAATLWGHCGRAPAAAAQSLPPHCRAQPAAPSGCPGTPLPLPRLLPSPATHAHAPQAAICEAGFVADGAVRAPRGGVDEVWLAGKWQQRSGKDQRAGSVDGGVAAHRALSGGRIQGDGGRGTQLSCALLHWRLRTTCTTVLSNAQERACWQPAATQTTPPALHSPPHTSPKGLQPLGVPPGRWTAPQPHQTWRARGARGRACPSPRPRPPRRRRGPAPRRAPPGRLRAGTARAPAEREVMGLIGCFVSHEMQARTMRPCGSCARDEEAGPAGREAARGGYPSGNMPSAHAAFRLSLARARHHNVPHARKTHLTMSARVQPPGCRVRVQHVLCGRPWPLVGVQGAEATR